MSDHELTDGWGDEEDLELDDEEEEDHNDTPVEQQEEEEVEEEEVDEEEEVVFHSTIPLAVSPASKQRTRKTLRAVREAASKRDAVPFAEELENTNHTALDAWDFEDDDDDALLDSATPSEAGSSHYNPQPQQQQPITSATATSFSLGSFSTNTTTAPVMDVDDDVEALYHDLEVYVTHHLELLGSSINAILAAEYNTPDHAEHLVQYYQQRPQLAQYTLEKELTRMQYHVQVQRGAVLTDPTHICDYFQKLLSSTNKNNPTVIDWNQVLLGASNQSLLADLLHVMTGPDRLVRPQYFTSCMATQCRFQMNLTQSAVVVTCHADFEMTLPCHANNETGTATTTTSSSSSSRLTVATFAADITFQPSVSMIHYEISKLNVVLNQRSDKEEALRSVASFLKEMMMMSLQDDDDDMFESAHPNALHTNINNNNDESSADMFRDMFLLEQTQDFIKAQQLGMKSAWNQMGAVVNLQSKLETVGNLLPSLLSSGQEAFLSGQEAFLSAAAAATASATNLEPQLPPEEEEEISFSNLGAQESDHSGPRLARSHHARPVAPFGAPPVRPPPPNARAVPPPPPNRPPPPPLPPRATTATPTTTNTTTDRPTSILGGFISRLAQSVTNIPDEEDIYRKEYGFSTTDANLAHAGGGGAIPQLYRRDDVPPNVPHQPQPHRSVLPAPPSLGYSQPVAPPPPQPASAKPPVPTSRGAPQPPPAPTNRGAPPFQPQQQQQHSSVTQAHALPSDDVVVQDGWDDIDDVEDELLFEDDANENGGNDQPPATSTSAATVPAAGKSLFASTPAPSLLPTDKSYNPEDDIIEPRKRWVNPRPGFRQIAL